jgi:hypothetical protein
MDRSPGNGGDALRRKTALGRSSRRRSRTKLNPSCEVLDDRQLLSTGVSAAALANLAPPSAAVANAAAILDSLQPTDFARFENDLAKAESHSRVNAAEINALAQDEVALNQMIQSAGLHPHTSLGSLNLQDVVDDALKDTPSEAASNRAPLDEYVAGVPGGPQLVHQTIAQMQVVARAARVSPQLHAALSTDWSLLETALGPKPDTNLGPGATDRDPLEVYFNGQAINFVR